MRQHLKTVAMIGMVALVTAACGGGDEADTDLSNQTSVAPADVTTTTLAATTTSEDSHTDDSMHENEEHHDNEEAREDETAPSDADLTVEVVMDEFTFEPSSFEVAAGQTINFVVENVGRVEHEFRASNEHRIEEHLASGHDDHDDDGGHHEEDGDVVLVVQPGETDEVTMTFPEDTTIYTEIACLLPGHYEAGMKAPITYVAS